MNPLTGPQPPLSPELPEAPWSPVKPVRGFAIAAIAGLAVVSLAKLSVAVANLQLIGLVDTARHDPRSANFTKINTNQDLIGLLGNLETGGYLFAAVVFLAWLFRARGNSEVINDFSHRWGRPWLVVGWFIPILNLWIPRQIVGDLWRASAPATSGSQITRRPWIVYLWWMFYVVSTVSGTLVGRLFPANNLDSLRTRAADLVVLAPISLVAAVLAAVVVWRISRFQEQDAIRIGNALA